MREIRALDADYSEGPALRFGLISLASDQTASDEIRGVIGGADRAVYETRIPNSDRISTESLMAMKAGLAEAAGRLPPVRRYDGVAYLCTSASTLMGSDVVAAEIALALPGTPVTDPIRAAERALAALGIRRIALVTPYVAEVTGPMADAFERRGVTVSSVGSFMEPSDDRTARISADAIERAVCAVAGDAEAVFVSCTALATVAHVARFERTLGRPVLSSNQVVAWDLLRMAGAAPARGRWGSLLGADAEAVSA